MKKLPYEEGSWFLVPMGKNAFVPGLIARMAPEGKVLLGYFFGKVFREIPSVKAMDQFQEKDAVKIHRFGDLGLINGEWPILGRLPLWNRNDWPMPAFMQVEPISNRVWKIEYPDENPGGKPRRTRITGSSSNLPKDGMGGYKYIEEILQKYVNLS